VLCVVCIWAAIIIYVSSFWVWDVPARTATCSPFGATYNCAIIGLRIIHIVVITIIAITRVAVADN